MILSQAGWEPSDGSEVRARLGPRYYLLAPQNFMFECHWHRHAGNLPELYLDHNAGSWSTTGEQVGYNPMLMTNPSLATFAPDWGSPRDESRLGCESDPRYTWEGERPLRSEALIDNGLPHIVLPDNRRVWCIPPRQFYGSILSCEWAPIVERAKQTHKAILLHAYEVTLLVLQHWKKIAPRMADHRRTRFPVGGQVNTPAEELSRVDQFAEVWVCRFSNHLLEDTGEDWLPSEEAVKALSVATGFGPEGIRSAVRRTRAKEARKLKTK